MSIHSKPRLRAFASLAIAGAAMLAVGACGSSYDRNEAVDDLVNDAGLERPVAECVVDKLEDEFGTDKLGSSDDPTDEEVAFIFEAMTDCGALGG